MLFLYGSTAYVTPNPARTQEEFRQHLAQIQDRLDAIGAQLKIIEDELNKIKAKLDEIDAALARLQEKLAETVPSPDFMTPAKRQETLKNAITVIQQPTKIPLDDINKQVGLFVGQVKQLDVGDIQHACAFLRGLHDLQIDAGRKGKPFDLKEELEKGRGSSKFDNRLSGTNAEAFLRAYISFLETNKSEHFFAQFKDFFDQKGIRLLQAKELEGLWSYFVDNMYGQIRPLLKEGAKIEEEKEAKDEKGKKEKKGLILFSDPLKVELVPEKLPQDFTLEDVQELASEDSAWMENVFELMFQDLLRIHPGYAIPKGYEGGVTNFKFLDCEFLAASQANPWLYGDKDSFKLAWMSLGALFKIYRHRSEIIKSLDGDGWRRDYNQSGHGSVDLDQDPSGH